MLAAERYKSVWNMFLQALNHDPTACLRAFQCEQHVNKRSMARWMQNNGLSVRKAKTLLHESKKSADKQMPPSDSMFLPVTADFTLSHKETSDMLYGVCFTFPDGTQVNIKRGYAYRIRLLTSCLLSIFCMALSDSLFMSKAKEHLHQD